MWSLQSKFTIWASIGLLLIAGFMILYSAISLKFASDSMIRSSENMVNRASAEFSDSILDIAHDQLYASAKAKAMEVESSLNGAIYSTRTFASLMTGLKAKEASASGINRERVILLVKGILQNNDNFLSAYTGWEKDQFDGFGFAYENLEGHDNTGRFIPYWFRTPSGKLKLLHLIDYEDHTHYASGIRFGEYYLRTRESKKECIIGPYRKKIDNNYYWITSLVTPIILDNVFFGIAGIDVKLDYIQRLSENVAKSLYSYNSRVVIISNEGIIAADSHEPKRTGQLFLDWAELEIVKDGREYLSFIGDSITIMYPLRIGKSDSPWSVRIEAPKEVVLAEARQIQRSMNASLSEIGKQLEKENNQNLYMQLLLGSSFTVVIIFVIYLLARKELQERKRAEDELRRLRNYLSNIINSMPSMLVGVNIEGKITQWNNEARRVTGIDFDDAVGQPLDKILPRFSVEMAKIQESIKTRQMQTDLKRARKERDQVLYEDVTIYPLIANGVQGAVIRVDDVTDRVRLEEMMVQTEKMMSVGGLAAGMAHEINNPLGAIIQGVQNISRRLSSDMKKNQEIAAQKGLDLDALSEYLEARDINGFLNGIKDAGIRSSEIVKNMLNFSRQSEADFQDENVNDLVDEMINIACHDYDLKKGYDFKKVKIVRQFADNLSHVSCVKSEIQQVILNLLKNGAEIMSEKSHSPQWEGKDYSPVFHVRTYQKNKFIYIEVEDNGPGMDESTMRRVFEPFFTTKPVGKGTGLGLSVSYFIVTQNHRGNMWVESEEGRGAKFVIKLPIS